MLLGPVETQDIPEGSLDVIVLMDVLEHFLDPVGTLRHCLRILKRDGFFFLQTPNYPEGKTREQMEAGSDPFLQHLKPDQHLYLFSHSSVRRLFRRLGAKHISFEPAIFSFYDMSLVASRSPVAAYPGEEVVAALDVLPTARITLALLDLDERARDLYARGQEAQAAHTAQTRALEDLRQRYAVSEADRAARLENLHKLEKLLAASEADRAARLENLHNLEKLQSASEADRVARTEALDQQGARLAEVEAARNLLAGRCEGLEKRLEDRSSQCVTLDSRLAEVEAARNLLAGRCEGLEKRLEDRAAQCATLDSRLAEVEAARNLLAGRCEGLEKRLEDRTSQCGTLDSRLAEVEAARNLLAGRCEELKKRLEDRTSQCGTLDSRLASLEAEQRRLSPVEALHAEAAAKCIEQQTVIEKQTARLAELEAEGGRLRRQVGQWEDLCRAKADLLDRLHHSHVFAFMRRLGLWAWLAPEAEPGYTPPPRPPRGLKRVAVDLTPVLPGGENGGAKVMALELLRHLGRIAPECEFILLTAQRSHEELAALDAHNIKRLCVRGRNGRGPGLRPRRLLARILPPWAVEKLGGLYGELTHNRGSQGSLVRQLDADLLFCPFTAPYFFDPAVPVVSVVHDLQHIYYPQFFNAAVVQERDQNFRLACRVASRVVCVSDHVRQTVVENSGLSAERVETVHTRLPGRLQRCSRAVRDRVLRSLGLAPGRFLLYPANFWPHKNHEMLLAAFGMYHAANPDSDLKLVLTGAPGTRRDELIEATRRMGLGVVLFPGYLPDKELAGLMESCQAVIFPSLFEGFGIPVMEAMALGRPLLCSNAASLPEVTGGAALLFDPRKPAGIVEAISRLERDPELRRNLAAQGAERLATFGSTGEMAAQYLKIFREVVERRPELPPALYGRFADGWVGEQLTAVFGCGAASRQVVVKLVLPDWVPAPMISVSVRRGGGAAPEGHKIARGETATIRIPITSAPGLIDIQCLPVFQPSACGMGGDTRSLACLLEAAEIVGSDGTAQPLKPEMYVG
jgi:glycosyltransferase involved in cell wall biosynthesis